MKNQKRKYVKLYNIGFAPIFLYIFPGLWLISLPLNFVIDSIVLLIGLKLFVKKDIWKNYLRSILWVWICGYVADVIGALVQIGFEFLAGSDLIRTSVMANPFANPFAFFATLISVGIAAVIIFFANKHVTFRKLDLAQEQKRKIALLLTICTTPYLFFLPIVF